METKKRKKTDMTKIFSGAKDLTEVIALVYTFVMLTIFPLYCKGGFDHIGNVKYNFFYSVSITIFCIFIPLALLSQKIGILTLTDKFVAVYGIVVILSFTLSEFPNTALWGFDQWYMGLFSQMIFVLTYFMISRCYRPKPIIFWGAYIASAMVFSLGILNRFSVDLLGFFNSSMETWNLTHMLSTIGNINWYAGYLCLLFPFGIFVFWNSNNKKKNTITGSYLILGYLTFFTQGSESAVPAIAAVMFLLFLFSFRENRHMKKYLLTWMLMSLSGIFLRILLFLFPKSSNMVADSFSVGLIESDLWIVILLLAGILYVLLEIKEKQGFSIQSIKRMKMIVLVIVIAILEIFGASVLIYIKDPSILPFYDQFSYLQFGKAWGNGRGHLWNVTIKTFLDMPLLQKLVGVGPDCFQNYVYTYELNAISSYQGQWSANMVAANAHNEWLTLLINYGIIGLAAYLGIFIAAIIKCLKNKDNSILFLGYFLCLVSYMINGIFSFQQVVTAPILFIIFGIIENKQLNEIKIEKE